MLKFIYKLAYMQVLPYICSVISWRYCQNNKIKIRIMQTTKLNFGKNFRASVEIAELEKLGWEFDPTYEDVAKAKDITEEEAKAYENDNYHVEITVDQDGKTFNRTVNTQQKANGINEGSDDEATGDDAQTIEDLKKLYAEGKLWNEENFIS